MMSTYVTYLRRDILAEVITPPDIGIFSVCLGTIGRATVIKYNKRR